MAENGSAENGSYVAHDPNLHTHFTDYGEIFRDRMVLAGLVTGADYVQALRLRRELVDELDRTMIDLDLVMTAVVPSEAPPMDEGSKFGTLDRPSLTMPFKVTGSQAISVCCGIGDSGLPLSL